jgi:hypothetical protein
LVTSPKFLPSAKTSDTRQPLGVMAQIEKCKIEAKREGK